jgi:Predicted nucleotidyltransferases
MPPLSSTGSVLRWPSDAEVLERAAAWAQQQLAAHPDLEAVGVFGSYGRGDAGVGSDLDLLLILHSCDLPVWERLRRWDTAPLPLATDLLVYSRAEWERLRGWNPAFAAVLARDLRWLASRDGGS